MSTDLTVQGTEIVAPVNTLFGTDNPAEVVLRASEVAKTLAHVVRSQNLIVRIGQSDHVRVEGWTFLGSILGVFPIVEWTRPVFEGDVQIGWEARVEARTRAGETVGSAEAECLRSEAAWSHDPPPNKWGKKPPARDDYALRSMAQTRAVSKALRLPLGYVMQLAGFDPTPAEEMPGVVIEHRPSSPGGPEAEHSAPRRRADGSAAAGSATVSQAVEGEPAPPGEDPDPTFGPAPRVSEDTSPLLETDKMWKKLNTLVGKKNPDRRRLYVTVAIMRVRAVDDLIMELGGMGEDGQLHFPPLRDSLTRAEAHELIDRLEKLEDAP